MENICDRMIRKAYLVVIYNVSYIIKKYLGGFGYAKTL